jgi:hypothetical protein
VGPLSGILLFRVNKICSKPARGLGRRTTTSRHLYCRRFAVSRELAPDERRQTVSIREETTVRHCGFLFGVLHSRTSPRD